MEAVNAQPIIEQLHQAGLSLTVKPNGNLSVSPSTSLTDDLRSLIRENKPVLIDWLRTTAPGAANDPTTTPRHELTPKLKAASEALDRQIVAAGLSLTPSTHPVLRLATNQTPKQSSPHAKRPEVEKPWHRLGSAWCVLAEAYNAHHVTCNVCIAAGRGAGYGLRCGVGASLWTVCQSTQ